MFKQWLFISGLFFLFATIGSGSAVAAGEVPEQLGAKMLQAAGLISAVPRKGSDDDGPDFGDDNGGERGDDRDDDRGDDDLAGSWNGSVSFPGNPGLDHAVTWTFSPLFDDVYTLTARRASDGAQQSGIGVELSHSRPDIGLYTGFDNATCRVILVGDSNAFSFNGMAIYKCADGFTATGSFAASR